MASEIIRRRVKKRVSFNAHNMIYFTCDQNIYRFDGTSVERESELPSLSVNYEEIMVIKPVQKKKYLEIQRDKSIILVKRRKRRPLKKEFMVRAYCKNPPILALEDGRFVRVVDGSLEETLQVIPTLAWMIPPIPTADHPQVMEFVDDGLILLRQCITSCYTWKNTLARSEDGLYIDWTPATLDDDNVSFLADKPQDLLGIIGTGDSKGHMMGMFHSNNELRSTGVDLGRLGAGYILPYISTWNRIVVKDNDTFIMVRYRGEDRREIGRI